jgi:hypothetical protein
LHDSSLNGQHLLSDDRQYFKINSVELIETIPATGRGKALKEFSHGLVTEIGGAVENNTLYSQSFSEILNGLSLTSTGGAFWSTTIVELLSTHEGSVTSVGERSDNQSE